MDVTGAIAPGHVTGVDFNAESVAAAMDAALEPELENVSFQLANATDLPFPDDSFDLAFCSLLLEWVQNPVAVVVSELRRVVAPGRLIAAGMLDIGAIVFYPSCPALEVVYRAS